MNPRLVIPVMWILAGAFLVKLRAAWSRLPERVAVHFGTDFEPNGWSSKATLAAAVLIAVPGQGALATFLLLRAGSSASGPMAVILLIVCAVLVGASWQTINYNANGTPFQALWVFVPTIMLSASIPVFLVKLIFDYYRR
jgi:hypothetical protein